MTSTTKRGFVTANQVKVYMDDADYERVKKVAKRAGLSVSTWIRAVVLKEIRKDMDDKAILEAARKIEEAVQEKAVEDTIFAFGKKRGK